ncbi:hypothetical protein CAEBREN_03966 [Caenorhabditis brenneri]|uniref:Uncharacterized protein n=1 Tax=Caenorhabditis brenneri TaxID=135651 RepID=G0M9U0_CAEBE|nr:hypothetical protein CAEBREN_03966 [Caenorhabditis brenneri]
MKLRRATFTLAAVLEELDGFEEGDCGYLGDVIKSHMANKYIENTWTEFDRGFNGPFCECTRLYEAMIKVMGKSDVMDVYRQMSIIGINKFAIGCSLDFKKNAKFRDWLYPYYLEETPPNIDFTKSIYTEGGCELCIYHDYSDEEIDKNTEYYQTHCMEIYENYWKSEMPSVESLCFRCVSKLSYKFVGECCREVKEQWGWRRLYLKGDELTAHRRRFGARRMDSDVCKHGKECILTDKTFWKYAVKLDIREKAYKIFTEQICERPEVLELLDRMDQCIGEIDLREDTKEELLGKVARIDEILEELKIQWENYECRMEE